MTHHQDIVDRANKKYPITTNIISHSSVSDENDRIRALRNATIEAQTFEREQGNLFVEWTQVEGYAFTVFIDTKRLWVGDNGEYYTTDELRQIFNDQTTTP